MKILIISRGYPTPAEPMNGLFEWDQARALQAAGHEVVFGVVDLRSLRHRRRLGQERFVRDRISVEAVHWPAGRIPFPFLHTMNVQAITTLYRRVLQRHGLPDVIHSHFLRMGAATVVALGQEPVPRIHTEHYSGLNADMPSVRLLQMGQATYPQMDGVVAVSGALAHRLRELFAVEARIIPNVVDLTQFYPPIVLPDAKRFHFVSTGHLLPNKRMDLLIAAFHCAFGNSPEIDLTIFGAGPERDALTAQIEFGPAVGRIHLAGHQPRQIVAETLRKSHAFVLLSRRETFGLAYVEAMATGLPIIAAESGGPADFIRRDTGRMVADEDPVKIASLLQELVAHYEEYDRTAIARYARETFSPEAVAAQLTAFYAEIIQAGHGEGDRE
jgi:glycosyltransferase involved in cell wall biosynthesis